MLVLSGDVLTIFWIAAVPAFLAVFLLTFGVREQGSPEKTASASPLRPAEFARLNSAVWTVIAAASCLTLARFSEAFLLLKSEDAGFSRAWIS